MTKATTPSGSIDEAIAFRQGVSVVTIKDQLTGMLPKFSAGTRSRIVIDGNAPDSDVYYDDSMVGLGPGTIVPTPAQIFPVFLFDHDFSKFEEIYNIEDPGIFNLQVSGSYTGKLDATFRIQIANPDDDDVYTISSPVYDPIDPGSSGLNDLSVVVQNITEINDEGEETVLVSSGSYDMSQGISVYKVEIATAEQDAVDTIRWYKNGELLAGSEEVITARDGNELIDGNNKIVVKFEYDGYEDIRFGAEVKHTPGDSWTIVAGTQQIRWSKGEFDSQESATLQAIPEKEQATGGPVGILQSGYQLICDGVYIKLPSQVGYPDGSDPNVEASLWQFDVTSLKPEAAITAMQDAAGKIQIFPDHRTEQRDFGQPKFHNDFDVVTIDQQQVSTVEVLRIEEIGQQNPSWVSSPGTDINALPRTPEGNTRLYSSAVHGKRNLSYEEANLYDTSVGIPVDINLDPLKRTWQNSSVSDDGSVGPYFTVRDLRGKQKKSRNNHFWFNFGYTTTSDITKYDDKNPFPQLSDPVGIDISGRDLSAIEFFNQPELSTFGEYEVYNIPAILPISQDLIIDAQDYWSNDAGVTMVSATDVHPTGIFPTSVNSSGNTLYYLASSNEVTYKIAATVGWDPDIDEDDDPDLLPSKMSKDIYGNVLLDPATGIPTPLEQDAWMSYHGYSIASIDEIPWMQKEGYVAYEDALHNRYFTLYDEKYQGYYVQLNVTDNLSSLTVANVEADVTLDADQWLFDGNKKSKDSLRLIRVDLNRFDSAEIVSEKIIGRINNDIPSLLLDSAHPFYSGANCSSVFVAKQDENDAHITKIQLVNDGKIQDSDVDPLLSSNETFQVYTTHRGSLGYAQNVLLSNETSTAAVGNCICLYTSTAVGALPAGSPFVIWFNLNGTSLPPVPEITDPADPSYDPLKVVIDLWSYDIDEDYVADIKTAFEAGNSLEILMFPTTPGRTLSYMVNQAIQNNGNFLTSFMPILGSGSSILRIMQRDPGPVVTPLEDIPDQTCHKVNSEVTVNNLREGVPLNLRSRDYISDSIVFAVNDPEVIKERFFAEKRVVKNYAHFQVNCVAEEKSGLLFDYSNQEWVDPDPDVGPSLAKILKGGKAELSNYEPNIVELFNNIPQKEVSSTLMWKRLENSTTEIVATTAGFDIATSMYDSRNRKIWTHDANGTFHTAISLGIEDDEVDLGIYTNAALTEVDWMTFEGYIPVPAFTHKIAQASYFLLPHPEKNFYVWFDVGQLSADPGDDGALDDIVYFDQEGNIDRSYIGGGVRIALDSYDTAGIVAQKLVDRINSDRYDTKKVFVQINVDDDGEPEYQALDSGNINKYFEASVNQDDSSIVDIICKVPGLINTSVFEQNDSVNFPVTDSGDEFSITLIDDGDTDYYVDITNSIPGFLVPPTTDVVRPDADAGLPVTVTDVPYSPAQPGLTKTLSSFLPYEDMNSMSRGYRKTLEDGTEIALAGPVAYIEDDTGSLMYPVIMSNVSMKDPDQYDGVIEPLEIRSRASRNSPDAYFVAHDIKGELQSDVASDSRKRSNPITQFINNAITKFEPYEDGIEHMESSPSVESFIRNPVFNGTGINDLSLGGEYSASAGSPPSLYYVECVTAYDNSDVTPNDKFRWKKNDEDWSDVFELENTEIGSNVVITFDGIRPSTVPEIKTINVPVGSYGYTLEIYAQGDINSVSEFYTIQYLNEQLNPPEWTPIALPVNDLSHPLYTPNPVLGSGYVPGRYGYSPSPHITIIHNEENGVAETIPLIAEGSLKIRVLASPDVNTLLGVKNNVKIATSFLRTSGYLSLDNGLYCVFDNKNGHTAGDDWVFEAVSKTHYDSVGYLPFPGYLTWQESKVDPFVESSDPEESTKKILDNNNLDTFAIATMAFNYDGFSSVIPASSSTWEVEYLRSLNGQAFTLSDTEGTEVRFEFDNDNVLENDGDVIVPLLRSESLFIRFPDVEKTFQKRDAQGNLLWLDFSEVPNSFAAYATADSSAADYLSQDGVTNLENYDDPSGKFSEISEMEWAQYYNLSPDNVTAEDICPSLVSAIDYAGKYFIITDEVNSSMENINNTLVGGRYAVWFNVIDANTKESISSAPTFLGSEIQSDTSKDPEDNFLLYWDEDTLKWDVAINLGYPEAGYEEEDELTWSVRTGYYSTRSIREPKWSKDNGKTILCPMGEIVLPSGLVTGTSWNPDPSTLKMGTNSDGDNLWSNDGGVTLLAESPANPDPEGYERVFLSEEAWHEYEEYENYSHLIPQLIEVPLSSTDSVNILVKKTVKAINSFKNTNQARVFDAKYIHPPEYIDLYDLDPADAEDAATIASDVALGGTWVSADYDNILHVKLENDWFYQYAMDPNSPPNLSASARGWKRGFISIKISSKNVGYHNITSRLTDAILPHEPLYTNVPAPASIRSFTIQNDQLTEWGGYHTFEELLHVTSQKINSSNVKISSEVLYNPTLSQLHVLANNPAVLTPVYLDLNASNLSEGIVFTFDNNGGLNPAYNVYASNELIPNNFVRFKNYIDDSSRTYVYKDFLPGLKLTQGVPGQKGNKKNKFHHYKDDKKGNIILSNFEGGTSTGPHIDEMVINMYPGSTDMRPHDHKSSAAGMIYNDMPCGTDSITFGGWKK